MDHCHPKWKILAKLSFFSNKIRYLWKVILDVQERSKNGPSSQGHVIQIPWMHMALVAVLSELSEHVADWSFMSKCSKYCCLP